MIRLGNIPDNLTFYYPQRYYQVPGTRDELLKDAHRVQHKVRLVMRHKPQGRMLEVGSGNGLFAYLAKNAGYEVQGMDMSAHSCEFVARELGIPAIQTSDIVQAVAQLGTFDIIAAWHVLEHLHQPWSTIDALARKLASGGILVLATPNPESLQLRIFGSRWAHIDAPRHITLIPIPVLRQRLSKIGLEEITITMRDRDTLKQNYFGWQHSLKNLAQGRRASNALRALGKVLAVGMLPIEVMGRQGSCYTAIFRNRGR